MIREVEAGKKYVSGGGFVFKVDLIARHGQDCSIGMVVYRNLEPTFDYPANQSWTIEENLFLKMFSEYE